MESDEDIPILIKSEEISTVPSTTTRVPLTVICGFLGAGKSTLLKRILTERHGYRIAVIMNEFGDTADIEAKTVNVSSSDDTTAEQSEEFLELANGCLCCSIKDSGIAAIEKLMHRKGAFDHILLETTGLADPGPIASMFWQNEEFAMGLGRDIALDGVICVVDALFGKEQMQEDHAADGIGESLRQIAGSDVILLNKVDLAAPELVSWTEEMIHWVNPAAQIYKTIRGDVDLGLILGISAYTSPPRFQPTIAWQDHDHGKCEPNDNHEHSTEATHYELSGISSLQVNCAVLDQSRFHRLDEWIRTVLWENQLPRHKEGSTLQVLRCKGLFTVEPGKQYVLQGVRSLYEIVEIGGQIDMGIPELGKIVLIGKGLNDAVRRSLEDAIS